MCGASPLEGHRLEMFPGLQEEGVSGASKLWTSQNEWGTPCFVTSQGSLLSLNLGHLSLFHTKIWREQRSRVGCQ